MSDSSASKTNRVLLVGAIVLIALVGSSCSKEPQLTVEEENTGAWIAVNNRLPTSPDDRELRSGLLFQLGAYEEAGTEFNEIRLTKKDNSTEQFSPTLSTFWWINVVADVAGTSEPPIEPDEAFGFFQNMKSFNSCDALIQADQNKLKWCESDTSVCASAEVLPPRCLRGRKLHVDLKVRSIMTLWQGSKGYDLKSELPKGDHMTTRFLVTIADPFKVDVYKTDPTAGDPMWTLHQGFAKGEIRRIEVTAKPSTTMDPDHSAHRDPPW